MVGIVLQAFRDFGTKDKGQSVRSVMRWVDTPGFVTICSLIDLDHEEVASVFTDLSKYDLPVRRKMIKEIIASVKSLR
jgi:hypothetical protein